MRRKEAGIPFSSSLGCSSDAQKIGAGVVGGKEPRHGGRALLGGWVVGSLQRTNPLTQR